MKTKHWEGEEKGNMMIKMMTTAVIRERMGDMMRMMTGERDIM